MLCAVIAVWVLAAAGEAAAHRGPPLRFGVLENSSLTFLSQVVLSYLSEAQGAPVQPFYFEAAGRLEEAFEGNDIDFFLLTPDEEWAEASCPAGTVSPEQISAKTEEYFRIRFPGVWLETFPFALGKSACSRPTLLVHSKVHRQLRFSLLLRSLETIVGAVGLEDVEWLRKAAGNDKRKRARMARTLLTRKGLW